MLKIPSFKSGGEVEIFYQVIGDGEPLLFISGLGSKMNGWRFQVPYFAQKGMKVIYFDNRGVGKSSRPDNPYSMDTLVSDAKNLLDHLKITEKINVCGISMGGMIAQQFALKHPEILKKLILLATTPKSTDARALLANVKLMEEMDEDQQVKSHMSVLFSREFYTKMTKDKVLYEDYKQNFLTDRTRYQDYVNQSSAIEKHDTRAVLHEIKIPTLIIVGTEDMLLPPSHSRKIHKRIPNSELHVIEGVGHGLTIEAADKINQLIWDFINKK